MAELALGLLAGVTAWLVLSLLLAYMEKRPTLTGEGGEIQSRFGAALIPAFLPMAVEWFPRLCETTETKLALAGRPFGRMTGSAYVAFGLGRSIVIAAIVLVLCVALRIGVLMSFTLALLTLVVSAGYAWNAVSGALAARRSALDREFPFFFDFVVMTKEAGATLVQSIELFVEATPRTRLARDMAAVVENGRGPGGLLGAMRTYIETCPSESGRNALTTIIEAEPLGAESGGTLREAAIDMRQQRNERAKSMAESLRTRIILPVMIMLVGVIVIVLSGSLPNFMFGFG